MLTSLLIGARALIGLIGLAVLPALWRTRRDLVAPVALVCLSSMLDLLTNILFLTRVPFVDGVLLLTGIFWFAIAQFRWRKRANAVG